MPQQRFATSLPTEFTIGNEVGTGSIGNVGSGGLFVESRRVPETGEMVRLRFECPDRQSILVSGIVWWTTDGRAGLGRTSGFGVRLLDFPEPYEAWIERLGAE